MKYRFLLKSFLILRKNQEFKLLTSQHFKNLITSKPAWNSQSSLILSLTESVESNFLRNIQSDSITSVLLRKRFLRKSSKPGHSNLVLIISTVQVELSKLNFNSDDIRMNFRQVLTFYVLTGFSKLLYSKCYDNARQNQSRTTTYN